MNISSRVLELVTGQQMIRYAVGGTFVMVAAASVVAVDDKQTWFHHSPASVEVSSEIAPPPSPPDAQPVQLPSVANVVPSAPDAMQNFADAPPLARTKLAANDAPRTDATPAPAPTPVPVVEPATPQPAVTREAPVPEKKAKELPKVTQQQNDASTFDNLLAARHLLSTGEVAQAQALLVYLQTRFGKEPAREDLGIAKQMLSDAISALDAGNTDRALHKINVATTCYTVHCPPAEAR